MRINGTVRGLGKEGVSFFGNQQIAYKWSHKSSEQEGMLGRASTGPEFTLVNEDRLRSSNDADTRRSYL